MSIYQVRTLDEADQMIKEHERKTKTVYGLLRSTKNFGCAISTTQSNGENEVRFETSGVPYCGVPFFVAGLKILHCRTHNGQGSRKRNEVKMEKMQNPLEIIFFDDLTEKLSDDGSLRLRLSKRKKTGGRPKASRCTATIIMKEIIYYPEFKIFEHTKNNRVTAIRQLKEALKMKATITRDKIIYMSVPDSKDHCGHPVAATLSKRLFIKDDNYGCGEAGTSKKSYLPIKKEKTSASSIGNPRKQFKPDEDDVEAKAKQVRETLQSIMGLTYKPGTVMSFDQLLKDLRKSRERYVQSMEELMNPGSNSMCAPSVRVIESQETVPAFSATPQVLTVQAGIVKNNETVPVAWQPTRAVSLPSSATVIPGSIVAVAGLPLAVSSASSGAQVVAVPNAVALQNTQAAAGPDPNNPETSIFIEAMEAIFNSQM